MKLTRERLISKIKRRLGGDFCNELEDDDFDDAIDSTDRWYLSWVGSPKEALLVMNQGEREISVPDDCITVLEVTLSARSTDFMALIDPSVFSDGNVSNSVPSSLFRPGHGGGIGDMAQSMAQMEMMAKVYGSERDWEWVRQSRKIRIYPATTSLSGGYAYIRYVSNDIDYDYMTPFEQSYYIRWMDAECKKLLGRVRSKYSNLPGPGDNIDIADGQSLLDEAKEEMQTIMEEVRQKPLSIIVG